MGRVAHNNGGNYHELIFLHVYEEGFTKAIFAEFTDTRDDFPGDETEKLAYDSVGKRFCIIPRDETVIAGEQVLGEFRFGEISPVYGRFYSSSGKTFEKDPVLFRIFVGMFLGKKIGFKEIKKTYSLVS